MKITKPADMELARFYVERERRKHEDAVSVHHEDLFLLDRHRIYQFHFFEVSLNE